MAQSAHLFEAIAMQGNSSRALLPPGAPRRVFRTIATLQLVQIVTHLRTVQI
ncbi:hypothetical protein [Scytonema sp. PCC 10023]|uniref:hypothetical protein n=1 Tax=Scytonema sp. PCC 10023 TaxID=1680591 RepID=UPI0039C6E4C3